MKYTVKPGDTLSDIAREHCGNSAHWRAILNTNIRTITKEQERRGTVCVSPSTIYPGTVLEIPNRFVVPRQAAAQAQHAPMTRRTIDTPRKVVAEIKLDETERHVRQMPSKKPTDEVPVRILIDDADPVITLTLGQGVTADIRYRPDGTKTLRLDLPEGASEDDVIREVLREIQRRISVRALAPVA